MGRGTERTGPARAGADIALVLALAAALLAPAGGPRAETAEAPVADAAPTYAPAAVPPSAAAGALALRLGGTALVLDLRAAGEARPLARAEAARLADGATRLLGWEALTGAPLLRRDIRAAEDLALLEALERHLPTGGTILALPGVSRRLAALLGAASFPLAAAAEPLAMPAPWAGRGEDIAAAEARQWGGAASAGAEGAPLAGFLDALLAEDRIGAARMRVLAGPGEGFVLVHLEDAFQLGLLRPGRMAMVRRDLAAEGFSHDLAREARRWAATNGQAAWAVDRGPDGRLRGHFLTDAVETATLVVQLLPFNTSRLDMVPGLRLVWQKDGYWLYRIDAITPPASAP